MSTNKPNLPSGITDEMLKTAIENPGMVVSKESATASAPNQHVPISGYGTNIKPNIKGNSGQVTGPSKTLGSHLAKQAQEFAKSENKRLKKEEEEKNSLSPRALRRDHECLKREVRRLQKQVKELLEQTQTDGKTQTPEG